MASTARPRKQCTLYAVEPQTYEIRVCFSVGHGLGMSDRARFALLASSWVPKPAGMLLWSALHLVLLVLGGALLVVVAAAVLALSLACDALFFPHYAVIGCGLLLWGLLILLWSLATLSLSLVREGERARQIRDACRRFADWWDPSKLPVGSPQIEWIRWMAFFGLFLTRHCVKGILSSPWWRFLRGCCEEIVHRHDTIGI